jgi:DNA polymerase IV
MNRLGIQTGADLRSKSVDFLATHFGKSGAWYYAISRGEDDRPVRANRERKSSGSETTFAEDLTDASAIEREVLGQADEVWALVSEGQCLRPYRHRQGQICEFPAGDPKPKFDDTRLIAVRSPRNQPRPRSKCLPTEKGIRLVGVSVSNFERTESAQLDFAI